MAAEATACKQSLEIKSEMVESEPDAMDAQLRDHVYLLAALHDGVELVRTRTMPGSDDRFSSTELMRMIRAAYCDPEAPIPDIAARIDADDSAIRLALNADKDDFLRRLIKLASC